MGDVPVAADDHVTTTRGEFKEMGIDQVQEAELGFLPLRGARARRLIERHYRQIAEVGAQVASFEVELRVSEQVDKSVRLHTAPQADATVASSLGAAVVSIETSRRLHFFIEICMLGFQFLDADDVRILRPGPGEQPLAPC